MLEKNQNYYATSTTLLQHKTGKVWGLLSVYVAISEQEAKGKLFESIKSNKEYNGYEMGNILCIKIPKEK